MKPRAHRRSSCVAILAEAKNRDRVRLNQLPSEETQQRVNYFPAKNWKLVSVPAWPSSHYPARAH